MEEQGTGYITVNVRTAGGALPVENAMITIKNISENGSDNSVVAIMLTDSSGTSEVVALPTPLRQNSQTPDADGEVSALYSIDTEKSGFYSVVNFNVPVFDGITSIQQVLLVPIATGIGLPPPSTLIRFNDEPSKPNL